jgi:hypothetical protein
MTPTRIRAAAALCVVGALALTAGCGGKDDDGTDTAFTKQAGDKIAAAAKADMKGLDEVKFSGEITSASEKVTLDVQADSSGDCTGSIGLGGGTAQIVAKDGTNWFKPDEKFWRANAGDTADAIIEAVGDKWVLDTDSNFSQFCDLDAFFDNLFKDDKGASPYKVTGTGEVDGQKVVKVEQSDDSGTATGYVLIDGEHYLVKLERTEGDEPGQLEFSDFNKRFDVTAPADDDVVDLDSLQ